MELYTKEQMYDYAEKALKKLALLEPNPAHDNPVSGLPDLPEPFVKLIRAKPYPNGDGDKIL